ncbi:MAG TPA: family 16 glycosylhydrolase [Cyclobacteriaceae bacterium]|nr:family 16 glycosylhydrolase [Cyclobacteriaceae bacterium]
MKIKLMTVVVFILSFTLSEIFAQGENVFPCPMGEGWVLDKEHSDEFNARKLDDTKWWDFNPFWHGRKPAYFSRENVWVKGGMLLLTAKEQDPAKTSVENKVRGFDKFTTATVKSKDRIRYGYFEARCKSMKAGVCNAFWLYDPLNEDKKYQKGSFSEEIDIFEVFGKPTIKELERVCFATVHRNATPYVESLVRDPFPGLPDKSSAPVMPFDFYEDFHVYALLWTPSEMIWYVDGKEVHRRNNDYYTTALHIMFACEIMESWAGLPDPADLPATFYIDYLRVWRLKEDSSRSF